MVKIYLTHAPLFVKEQMIEILGFTVLLGYLQAGIAKTSDSRKDSPNKQYSVKDAVLSAFAAFFMQCEPIFA